MPGNTERLTSHSIPTSDSPKEWEKYLESLGLGVIHLTHDKNQVQLGDDGLGGKSLANDLLEDGVDRDGRTVIKHSKTCPLMLGNAIDYTPLDQPYSRPTEDRALEEIEDFE